MQLRLAESQTKERESRDQSDSRDESFRDQIKRMQVDHDKVLCINQYLIRNRHVEFDTSVATAAVAKSGVDGVFTKC